MLSQAKHFAERLAQDAGAQPEDQIVLAFRLALARSPTMQEQQSALNLIAKEGLFVFCRALFNAKDFVIVAFGH